MQVRPEGVPSGYQPHCSLTSPNKVSGISKNDNNYLLHVAARGGGVPDPTGVVRLAAKVAHGPHHLGHKVCGFRAEKGRVCCTNFSRRPRQHSTATV